MYSIEKIKSRKTVADKKAIKEVQGIIQAQFPGLAEREIFNLPETVFSRHKFGFRYRLYVARDNAGTIAGFMIYSYSRRHNFYYLDQMAAAPGRTGQGIGRALYLFLHAKAEIKNAAGIFFECLNGDPGTEKSAEAAEQNRARLRFYERLGARPLANNRYHVKVRPENNSTLLVFDPLGRPPLLTRDRARKIVRQILKKKYSDYCPPAYLKMVIESFRDDPVSTRPARYTPAETPKKLSGALAGNNIFGEKNKK